MLSMAQLDLTLPDRHAPRPGAVAPERAAVQARLDAYVRAWPSFDPATAADLWTEGAAWYRQFDVRATGQAAISAAWLAERHLGAPDAYDARYVPIAIDGDLVGTHGRTRFVDPDTSQAQTDYDNVWVLRFGADGRCAEFHEWYAGRPEDSQP